MRKPVFPDASLLRVNDGAPVKVTFVQTRSNGHMVGFYTLDAGAFHDIRILFPNVGDTLIPNVSSVFLGNRLTGKTPVFFVVENGNTLNRDAAWFNDAAAGRNGFWLFLKRPEETDAAPVLEQGEIVWQKNGETVEPAVAADSGTPAPVLVWQSNSGRIHMPKGRIFHSFGYGLHPEMNPDAAHRFLLTPQEENASVALNFLSDAAHPEKPEITLNLQIGERNFQALTRNRIVNAALPVPDQTISSATVRIPDEFEDTLYLDGFEGQQSLPAAGTVFSIETAGNVLTLTGEGTPAVYEALLSCVKIRTEASAPAKSPVSVTYQTASGEIVRSGESDILSDSVLPSPLLTGLPPVKQPAAVKPLPEGVFTPAEPQDELPSFLTRPVAAVEPVEPKPQPKSGAKTALVTGGARKIGAEIARALAAKGCNVIVHCHTAAAEAARLVEELRRTYQVKAAYFRADFSSYDETADLVESVTKTYGAPDILVSCATVAAAGENPQGWDECSAVNARAPFILLRSFARALPKGKSGCFLAVFPRPADELSVNAFSLSGIGGLVEMAARTLRDNVRVNGVDFPEKGGDADTVRRVADAVCFMAQTPVVSGQVLHLDAEKRK